MKEKNSRKERRGIMILLIILIMLLVSIMATYAKYTGTISSNGGVAYIGTWDVTYDDSSTIMDHQFTNNLFSTVEGTKVIVPGVSGSFNIALKNKSDVAVKINEITLSTTNTDAKIQYSLLNENDYVTGLDALNTKIAEYLAANATNSVIPVGSSTAEGTSLEIPVYWKWAYYENDEQDAKDTKAGEDSAKSLNSETKKRAEYNIDVNVKAVQVAPTK